MGDQDFKELGVYAADFLRGTRTGSRIEALYRGFDIENLTPERLAEYVKQAAQRKGKAALDRVLGSISNYRANGLGREVYRKRVSKYVESVLDGNNLGAEINEVSADFLRNLNYVDTNTGEKGEAPLGFNETAGGRKKVYIPKIGENVGVTVSEGVQDYIRLHETLETNWEIKPRSKEEHELFDGMILDALKSLSKTSKKARQAYRGAISVYEARGESDPYFMGVSKFYPVKEEIKALQTSL